MSTQLRYKGRDYLRDLYISSRSIGIRKTPVTIEDLKQAGMTKNAIDHYFDLIKILYTETMLSQRGTYEDERPYNSDSLKDAWSKLELFCCNQNLIKRFIQSDGSIFLYSDSISLKDYFIIEHFSEYPWDVFIRSFDDFRRYVEIELSGIDLASEYIYAKYGVKSEFDVLSDLDDFSDAIELVSFHTVGASYEDERMLTYNELNELHKKIQHAMENTKTSFTKISAISKGSTNKNDKFRLNSKYENSFTKEIPTLVDTYRLLKKCEDLIANAREYAYSLLRNGGKDILNEDYPDKTLYIHKGRIICQKKYHNVVQATAVLSDKNGNDIKLNVSYCTNCKKFFMHYDIYNHYRKKYGVILGDLRMLKHDDFHGDDAILADESPLKLCGYSVSKQAGLSGIDRRSIITHCLENGYMTKSEVINLLRWLIEVNGAKKGNEDAVNKWERDLDYVLAYNIDKQHKVGINKITKYQNRFYIDELSSQVTIAGKATGTLQYNNSDLLGKRIFHAIWGEGTIIDQSKDYVTVNFFNGTIKDVLLSGFEKIAKIL